LNASVSNTSLSCDLQWQDIPTKFTDSTGNEQRFPVSGHDPKQDNQI